jgi:hypothetical protein
LSHSIRQIEALQRRRQAPPIRSLMAKQPHRVYQSGWLDVRKPEMKQPPVNKDIVANDVPAVEVA